LGYGLCERQSRFDPKQARSKVLRAERFDPARIVRYALRPFDNRWCYYTGIRPVWNEPRPRLWAQCWRDNSFLLTRFKSSKAREGPPFYFTKALSDDHLLSPDAVAIPVRLRNGKRLNRHEQESLFTLFGEYPEEDEIVANLSERARKYLACLKIKNADGDAQAACMLWWHSLAIGYSQVYLSENADGIRDDWPRIPLPDSRKLLTASAGLGRQIAVLLDAEASIKGLTFGSIRPELRVIASLCGVGKRPIELSVSAGWGHGGKEGVTMPGQGKLVARDYTREELNAFRQGAPALRMTLDQVLALFGVTTYDVYLNDVAYWSNVPAKAWDYVIGGYQVIKKWLSYREREILGRGLAMEEAREVTHMARRIGAILLLQPGLDANYRAVKASTYTWE